MFYQAYRSNIYIFSGESTVIWIQRKDLSERDYPFSTYAKISEKLTFLTPLICTCTCAYQGVRNVTFSENYAYVLHG